MKAITLNSYKNLNEIEFKNIEELYKKCGYKSNKDFNCLHTINTNKGKLEFWGKKTKNSFLYYNIELYSKCAILLFTNEYVELTIDKYNDKYIDYINKVEKRDNNEEDSVQEEDSIQEEDSTQEEDTVYHVKVKNKKNNDVRKENFILNIRSTEKNSLEKKVNTEDFYSIELKPETYIYSSDED